MNLLKYYAESAEAYNAFVVEKFTGSRATARQHEPEPEWQTTPPRPKSISTTGPLGKALDASLRRQRAEARKRAQAAIQEHEERERAVKEKFRFRMPAIYPQPPEYLRTDNRPKMQEIIVEVARYYNISVTDILSERRTAPIVKPRQEIMALARGLTLRSLPEIGRRIGGRDHTTVLHAVRKILHMNGFTPQDAFTPAFSDWCKARFEEIKAVNADREKEI